MEEKLIEAVRPHKVLYDTNDVDYMKAKLKIDLWKKISDDLELENGEVAKDMWSKLRSCHRDALRRQKKCYKSGAAAQTIKQWKFQPQMSFLLPYMTNRKRAANFIDGDDEDSASSMQNEIADIDANQMSDNNDTVSSVVVNEIVPSGNDENRKIVEAEDAVECVQNTSTVNTIFKEPQQKRKKKDISNLIQQSILNREERAKARAIERKKLEDTKPPSDSLYHFFMSMYHTTQKLPPATQLAVKYKIYEAVSQAEASLLNIPMTAFQHNLDRPQSASTWQYVGDSSGSQDSFLSNDYMDTQTQSGQSHNDLTNYYNNFQT